MISRQAALTKIFGDPQAKTVKRLQKRVVGINALADKYKKMTKRAARANCSSQKTSTEEGSIARHNSS